MVDLLGYNPGVDGHLFKSKEHAMDAWEATKREIRKNGYFIPDSGSHCGIPCGELVDGEQPVIIPQFSGRRIYDPDIAYSNVEAIQITVHV